MFILQVTELPLLLYIFIYSLVLALMFILQVTALPLILYVLVIFVSAY